MSEKTNFRNCPRWFEASLVTAIKEGGAGVPVLYYAEPMPNPETIPSHIEIWVEGPHTYRSSQVDRTFRIEVELACNAQHVERNLYILPALVGLAQELLPSSLCIKAYPLQLPSGNGMTVVGESGNGSQVGRANLLDGKIDTQLMFSNTTGARAAVRASYEWRAMWSDIKSGF